MSHILRILLLLLLFSGLLLFYIGMAINIHSDFILRNLRKPKEVIYKIPTGKRQISDQTPTVLVLTCSLLNLLQEVCLNMCLVPTT